MEVDELENGLLAQFGSMQTLDRDDLISQMLRLVGGSSLSSETAHFYLEMNQWNVQAAVCAYFDLEAGPDARSSPPQMTFVQDITIGEGEAVQPNTRFTKTWRVTNSGSQRWPDDCRLAGRRPVPALAPSECADLAVEMTSPGEPGIYEGKWRMSTGTGAFFGDAIWVIITVEVAGTLALTQQMSNFSVFDSGGEGRRTSAGNPFGLTARPAPDRDMM
eukprot:maker-scaffold1296_size49803-snap-gene-0.17 protein:Tk08820 transcript:maker-scaffold1296_size49803-snap-gene-0.17-mRNA-1 annotation:"c6orf106 homolog"